MPTSRPVQTSSKLGDILDEFVNISELSDEMVEWRDKMPDSLSGSEKYSQVDGAADSLDTGARALEEFGDNIRPILEKVPGILDNEIKYTMHLMYKGYQEPRWVRLANAVAAFEAAVEFIRNSMNSWNLDEEALESLKAELNNADDAISDLQGVEFPPMFG